MTLGVALSFQPTESEMFGKQINPQSLIFRESKQENLDAVRSFFPPGTEIDPILTVRTAEGSLILDGHNRAALAQERNTTVPHIEIPEALYSKLKNAGYDETDISHALLSHSGHEDAARGIRLKFPGVDFFRSESSIMSIIEDWQK